MFAIVAMLCLSVTPAEVATADRAHIPQSDWPYTFYLSTAHLDGELKSKTEAALAFTVASSSQQQIAEKAVPVKVADGLHRIDLRSVRWRWQDWHKVVAKYPYGEPHVLPLVVRGDWLIVQLSDQTQSEAYMLLLYGKAKITRDEYLKIWGVNNRVESHFGVIAKKEAGSPNVAEVRWVENRPTDNRGTAWGTRDSSKITKESDPLQHLTGDFQHEAEEWLIAMPKISSATGERGSLLAPFLANAKGEQQNEAPPSIVTDHHGFRGQAAIRAPGGCVSCHAQGINPPSVSDFRDYITAGVDIYARPKKVAEAIDLFHSSKPGKQIQRDNEDWETAVRFINGLDGSANAEAFAGALSAYDAPVSLESAAAELYTKPEELRLALGYASNLGVNLGVRMAGLAHGKTMPRATWEQEYRAATQIMYLWEKQK